MPMSSTPVYGIDTSVFVRLLTGHPESDFQVTIKKLAALHKREPTSEIVVSNQVIGEAYITLQRFYKLTKVDAKAGILKILEDGLVTPLHGLPILEILKEDGGAGLMDRLIAQDYHQKKIQVLTNDKKMAKIEGIELL